VTEHTGPFSLVLTRRAGDRFVRAALPKAAAVVAVGEPLRREMTAAGVRADLAVCGNPVAEPFTSRPVTPPGHRNDGVRAIFVGRLVAEKGLPELVEAAVAVSAEGREDLHWHFVGDGPMKSVLQEGFARAGRTPRLHLHGSQDRHRVASLMAESDFLVLPSHGETFGMVAAEALCLGLPVLTTHGTACADFVGKDDGVLVEPGNSVALAAGFREMCERLSSFDRQGIAARARERFSGAAVARWYGRLFREILGTTR
jgi:glycosyltransferase involved in cell wall biosynthesis